MGVDITDIMRKIENDRSKKGKVNQKPPSTIIKPVKPETIQQVVPVQKKPDPTPIVDNVEQQMKSQNPQHVQQEKVTPLVETTEKEVIVSATPEQISEKQPQLIKRQRQAKPQTDILQQSVNVERVNREKKTTREPKQFGQLGVVEKLLFRDVFTQDNGTVSFNANHNKTVAKNLSKGILDQLVDDLNRSYVGVTVQLGELKKTITPTNSVFNSPTSAMRYLMLDGLKDKNLALTLARQLYLEKYPDGEKESFDTSGVRSDELDVYTLLVASKTDPLKDLDERVKELTMKMTNVQKSTQAANEMVLNQSVQSNQLLNGVAIAISTLLVDHLGLTDKALPKDMGQLEAFMNQDNVVKTSDLLKHRIGADTVQRDNTIIRNRRSSRTRPHANSENGLVR